MAGRLPILPPTIETTHLYAAHIASGIFAQVIWQYWVLTLESKNEKKVMIMNFKVQCTRIIGQASLRKDEAQCTVLFLYFNS